MFSIYSSAFNLIKNQFNYEKTLKNWTDFLQRETDEIVIAVNQSEDATFESLRDLSLFYSTRGKHIKLVKTGFSYDSPTLDGSVKNAALQACGDHFWTSSNFCLQMDFDEIFPENSYEKFLSVTPMMEKAQCIMIPTIDLYKDINSYKSVGSKFRLHKKSGLYRGVVNFAKNSDGTHDITKSDSTELIDKNGNLASFRYILSPSCSPESAAEIIEEFDLPFVYHLGYLNIQKRIVRNNNFWKKMWSVEAGREVFIPLLEEEFNEKTYQLPKNLCPKKNID